MNQDYENDQEEQQQRSLNNETKDQSTVDDQTIQLLDNDAPQQEVVNQDVDKQEVLSSDFDGSLQELIQSAQQEDEQVLQMKQAAQDVTGVDYSNVDVELDSSDPEKLNAKATRQGKDIKIGKGNEESLPHELAHIQQGKVPVTTQKDGMPINDDESLEKQADKVGQKISDKANQPTPDTQEKALQPPTDGNVIQKDDDTEEEGGFWSDLRDRGEQWIDNGRETVDGWVDRGAETVDDLVESGGRAVDRVMEFGEDVGDRLRAAYDQGKAEFEHLVERLDPRQLAEALPSIPELFDHVLDVFWPSNTGWQAALAGKAGGTIAGTDVGFPGDIELGIGGNLELGVMRDGLTFELNGKVGGSQQVKGIPSIKAVELPIGVTLEACDAFKISMDVGNMNLREHLMGTLQERNLRGFFNELFGTFMSIGDNTQVEQTLSGSYDVTAGAEVGLNSVAKGVAEAGVKAGLAATFANPTETLEGKAELIGELSNHGKVGYQLAGGKDEDPAYIKALIGTLISNAGSFAEGGIEGAQGVGMRTTVKFPTTTQDNEPEFEVALFAKGELGLSLLGQSGKLSGKNEVILAMPEIQGFIDALESEEGPDADDITGLIPFSEINSEISAELTLRTLQDLLPTVLQEEDGADELNAKLTVKLGYTKERLMEIIQQELGIGEQIIQDIMAGNNKEALVHLLDLFTEHAANILSLIKAIEIETKSSDVNSQAVSTPLEGDVTGASASGSFTTSEIAKYSYTPEQIGINHLEDLLRSIVE